MSYSTLMVYADLGSLSDGLLRVTAELASLFAARVIGVAVCQPMLISYGDGYLAGDAVAEDRTEIDRETAEAEQRFRAALAASGAALEWRNTVGFVVLSDIVAAEARATDLLLLSPVSTTGLTDNSRHLHVGGLIMQVGRPVLIVPPDTATLDLTSVMVAWKDTRETRVAIVDALPLLRLAGRVTVVEVADEEELANARIRLADVVTWLARHSVVAERLATTASGADSDRLDAIAEERCAGLIVAGAYGHSRLREWMLGGVTRTLLSRPGRCALVSH